MRHDTMLQLIGQYNRESRNLTDGVMDHLHVKNAGEVMREIIHGIDTTNPAEFSRNVLEQVLLFTGGRVRDDMTVLTVEVWNR